MKAPSLVKGAPPRARARQCGYPQPMRARARDNSSSDIPPFLLPSAGARAAAQPDITGCATDGGAHGGGARGGGARGCATGSGIRGGARGGDHGGHGGPTDGGARLRSFRRNFPFLDFGFYFCVSCKTEVQVG